MKAMILSELGALRDNPSPLHLGDLPIPEPESGEVLVRVSTCGVCHTELDEIEGRTPPASLPLVLGHQAVGRVVKTGPGTHRHAEGSRVGVAWVFSSCGRCKFCRSGNENLCPEFRATGRDANGGYAEYMVVPEDFVYPIPETFSDAQAAPLLCAGAIGYRSLNLAGIANGAALGLTGFGASGHLMLAMARRRWPETRIYVFARSEKERAFAMELGAEWAGPSEAESPEKLDAIVDTTPVWKPVVDALKNLDAGGRLVINAIRKEDADKAYLLNLDYPQHLWMEKEIKGVANVSRKDVTEFLELAAEIPIEPEVTEYPLADANQALLDMKAGHLRGAEVLRMDS